MNRTLLGLAVMAALGATVARADDFDGRFGGGHRRAAEPRWGPRPGYAPRGQTMAQGRYELQTVQTWVDGQQQQVWVPGQCRQQGPFQRCREGFYRTVQTAGHYELRQEWVWVATAYNPWGAPQRSGRHHRAVPTGGHFSVPVY